MPEIYETENAGRPPFVLMSACFGGFAAGVAGDLHDVNGTSLPEYRQRMAWRNGFLQGAKAAAYLADGSEHANQRALFELASAAAHYEPLLDLMYAVPNGGQRSKAVAGKLKAEGVKPGVPDVFLPVARAGHHGLYIELKKEKSGRPSVEQTAWLRDLREQGYRAELSYGWRQAADLIQEYLSCK